MRERETWVIIGYCENGPVSQITVWVQDFPLTNMSASHSAPRYRAPSAFGARVRQMPAAATTTATCSRSTVTGRPSATCPAGSGTISCHLIFFFSSHACSQPHSSPQPPCRRGDMLCFAHMLIARGLVLATRCYARFVVYSPLRLREVGDGSVSIALRIPRARRPLSEDESRRG